MLCAHRFAPASPLASGIRSASDSWPRRLFGLGFEGAKEPKTAPTSVLVTTSKAPVTTSDALVTTSDAPVTTSVLVTRKGRKGQSGRGFRENFERTNGRRSKGSLPSSGLSTHPQAETRVRICIKFSFPK